MRARCNVQRARRSTDRNATKGLNAMTETLHIEPTPGLKLIDAIHKFPPGTEVVSDTRDGRRYGHVAENGFGVVTELGPNHGRVQMFVYETEDDGSAGPTFPVWADETSRRDHAVPAEEADDDFGTVKHVTVVVTAKFVGNYFSAGEVAGALEQWIDGGLEDRDDLRGWTVSPVSVIEVPATAEDHD